MLAEPPLVEIPIATSSGFAWAMSWRAKIASVPMSLAMAVMLAGSADRETAGILPKPGGGSRQSETRSFASVAERLLSFAEEGVEEGGIAHVMALFAMFEVHVDRLPEHVVEDLEDFLDNEGVPIRRRERILTRLTGQAER